MSQCRPDLVVVAGFGVAGAEGEVDGAADLFVEERVAGVAGDVDSWCRCAHSPRKRLPASMSSI